jgi:hypothetical protein
MKRVQKGRNGAGRETGGENEEKDGEGKKKSGGK